MKSEKNVRILVEAIRLNLRKVGLAREKPCGDSLLKDCLEVVIFAGYMTFNLYKDENGGDINLAEIHY